MKPLRFHFYYYVFIRYSSRISQGRQKLIWRTEATKQYPLQKPATWFEYAIASAGTGCLFFHHRICTGQPALARRDVRIQLFSLIMNASLCITATCHARSGPGVCARDCFAGVSKPDQFVKNLPYQDVWGITPFPL
jgi:hypothetical protein